MQKLMSEVESLLALHFSLLQVTDESHLTWLVLAVLATGVVLIVLLFLSSYNRPSGVVKDTLIRAITQQQFELLKRDSEDFKRLQEQIEIENGKRQTYELLLAAVKDYPAQRMEQQIALDEKIQTIKELESQIKTMQGMMQNDARSYAETIVGGALTPGLELSVKDRGAFFLQFTTIVIGVVSILVLALLGILSGEQLLPILTSIVGYGFGRVTNSRSREAES